MLKFDCHKSVILGQLENFVHQVGGQNFSQGRGMFNADIDKNRSTGTRAHLEFRHIKLIIGV